MTCREVIRLICEYLEGRLSSSVSSNMERHIHHCENCRIVLHAAEQTLETYFDGSHHASHRIARVA